MDPPDSVHFTMRFEREAHSLGAEEGVGNKNYNAAPGVNRTFQIN